MHAHLRSVRDGGVSGEERVLGNERGGHGRMPPGDERRRRIESGSALHLVPDVKPATKHLVTVKHICAYTENIWNLK